MRANAFWELPAVAEMRKDFEPKRIRFSAASQDFETMVNRSYLEIERLHRAKGSLDMRQALVGADDVRGPHSVGG